MKRELLSKAFGDIDESFILEAYRPIPEDASNPSERIVHMKKKRMITLALAAALMLALGITAYAVWSIHAARQQELKADLKIEENNVSSYTEYEVPDEQTGGLVLLSSVNDGELQHVYVDISPVTEEEAAAFPQKTRFSWSIAGTEIGGFAGPQLPSDGSFSGTDEIRDAIMKYAYDRESRTMTLQCYVDVMFIEKAMEELQTESLPLQVQMSVGEETERTYGPSTFTLTDKQCRIFDFGNTIYHDAELNKDIEIAGLELTPFSAVWKVRYEEAADFHTPEADWDKYAPWSALEDKVCIESRLYFSDGSFFSTGGALTSPYRDGVVNLNCGWGSAINIDDVQKIVLGNLILWQLSGINQERRPSKRASTRSARVFSAPGVKGEGKPASSSRSVQTFSPP